MEIINRENQLKDEVSFTLRITNIDSFLTKILIDSLGNQFQIETIVDNKSDAHLLVLINEID